MTKPKPTSLDKLQTHIAQALLELDSVHAPTEEHITTIRLLLERALVAANNIYLIDKSQCNLNWEDP